MKMMNAIKNRLPLKLRRGVFVATFALFACVSFSADGQEMWVKTSTPVICPSDSLAWDAYSNAGCTRGEVVYSGLARVFVAGVSGDIADWGPNGPITEQTGNKSAPSGGWTPGIDYLYAGDNCYGVAYTAFTVGDTGVNACFYDAPYGPSGSSMTLTLQIVCTDNSSTLGTIVWTYTGANKPSWGNAYYSGTPPPPDGVTVCYGGNQLTVTYTGACNSCQKINFIQTISNATGGWQNGPDHNLNPNGPPPYYYYPTDYDCTKSCGCN